MSDIPMPYYAEDTVGVHYQVLVDGRWVQAHVPRHVLVRGYGPCDNGADCMEVFRLHEQVLRDAVVRRVRAKGPETVIVTFGELLNAALDPVEPRFSQA